MPLCRFLNRFVCLLTLAVMLSACGPAERSVAIEQSRVEYNLLYDLPKETISFNGEVLPVLEKRCIVCHGCYDAPCQLKLSSAEGVYRGTNKEKVYDGTRITAAEPTRLFVDAMSTQEWRTKKFSSVLYEKPESEHNNPVRNLENSVMYQVMRLKQRYPQPRTGLIAEDLDISLDREQSCPTLDEFEAYANSHRHAGMPFAMPNLDRAEYKTLVQWIAQGAPVEADTVPSSQASKQIEVWERLLNGQSKKEKLISRYLYEHLFHAHLHFENTDEREFYRLVRSSTAPGDEVDIIKTRRPYGEVDGAVYYRLLRQQGSIVAKQHLVYSLSEQRLRRFKELFFDAPFEIDTLPSYEPSVASNPIRAFADIPVKSRYRFLLDDARFFIEGFIKGPVCRGQVALNVIEDQFWVAFFDPEAPIATNDDEFLRANAGKLASPAELEDTFNLLSVDLHYKSLFRQYLKQRDAEAMSFETIPVSQAMHYIWDGDGKEAPDSALTIFRHSDSASVNNGWLGDYPETAWIIDYSVLERIHYLLVAGFDVYGNIGHQLNTRLYMDFLRTEGENYFLAFLPVKTRGQLRDSWYQGIRESNKEDMEAVGWLHKELVKGYTTDEPQRELYHAMMSRLGHAVGDGDYINRCDTGCKKASDGLHLRVDNAMKKAVKMDGEIVQFLPDLTFIRVMTGDEEIPDLAYTMIYNKAYKSVSNMLQTEKLGDYRDYKYDTQTIVPWLEGSYPNFFYVVKLDDIERFVEEYNSISGVEEYQAFVMHYGIRRTHPDFWKHADWFNQQYRREEPLLSGIYDLNRYQNR